MAVKRRGRGEDSVYFDQANGYWVGSVSLGFSPDGTFERPGVGFRWSGGRACSREHHHVERPPTVPCTIGAPSRGQVAPGWRAAMMSPVCAPPLAMADFRTDFSAR